LTSSQFGPLRDGRDSPFTGRELPRSQFHFVWPNFGINIFPGRPNLSCGPIVPVGPERTLRFLDYFFAPDVEQEWVSELLEFDNEVGREDTELVERVHRGMRSGVLSEGNLMSASEPLVAHFQRLTADALVASRASS
jgi:choline monooxygenase